MQVAEHYLASGLLTVSCLLLGVCTWYLLMATVKSGRPQICLIKSCRKDGIMSVSSNYRDRNFCLLYWLHVDCMSTASSYWSQRTRIGDPSKLVLHFCRAQSNPRQKILNTIFLPSNLASKKSFEVWNDTYARLQIAPIYQSRSEIWSRVRYKIGLLCCKYIVSSRKTPTLNIKLITLVAI